MWQDIPAVDSVYQNVSQSVIQKFRFWMTMCLKRNHIFWICAPSSLALSVTSIHIRCPGINEPWSTSGIFDSPTYTNCYRSHFCLLHCRFTDNKIFINAVWTRVNPCQWHSHVINWGLDTLFLCQIMNFFSYSDLGMFLFLLKIQIRLLIHHFLSLSRWQQ